MKISDRAYQVALLIIGAILGLGLAMGWDTWKYHRERGDRAQAVRTAMAEDILQNRRVAAKNVAFLRKDVEALENGGPLVGSVCPLSDAFWDLARLDTSILTPQIMRSMRLTSDLVRRTNSVIQTRNHYWLANMAMSGYRQDLQKLDTVLLQLHTQLEKALGDFIVENQVPPTAQVRKQK